MVRTTKMKARPGQDSLIVYFYLNFVLICAYLLFGTWCFFYQDDATAYLEARYADKQVWDSEYSGAQLSTVQENIKLMLTVCGVISLVMTTLNFASTFLSMKIAMAFETIHTIVQVQNLVILTIAFLVLYAGSIAQSYYPVPQVSEAEPEFLPRVFKVTGQAMALVAYLGFYASRSESKLGMLAYIYVCGVLLVNFFIFTILLQYGSLDLQQIF